MSTARRIVGLAALLVPAGLRDDWRQEWTAEFDAFEARPRHRASAATRRAFGAFADAFWIRQRFVADFTWIDDLRHGWRQLAEHAGFAVMAVGILAIGLAASITMFSVTDQVLLRPLPYPEPDRIVTLFETRQGNDGLLEPAPGNFLDWRQRAKSFDALAGADPWSISYLGGSRPEVFFAAKITEGFFETFGLQPVAGRFFTADEYQKGRDQVLVLQETFWRQRFGGDPSIVGKPLKFDDGMFTVVGIAPAAFEPRLIPAAGPRTVWLPKVIEEYEGKIRGSGYWGIVGRLKPGIAIETAQAEITAISRQLATEFPRTNEKTGAQVVALRDHLVGNVRLAVTMLAGAVGLVLLIACVNVANLLLARG